MLDVIVFANDILMKVKKAKPKPRNNFFQAVHDYVKLHGEIKLDEIGLGRKVCYPKYNLIADFAEQFPKLIRE